MSEQCRVVVCDGKYTFIQHEDGSTEALRYGEPWRDTCGDGLILGLAQEVLALQERLAVVEKERDILIGAITKVLLVEGEPAKACFILSTAMCDIGMRDVAIKFDSAEELAKRAAEWIASPKGLAALKKASEASSLSRKDLDEMRKIDPLIFKEE